MGTTPNAIGLERQVGTGEVPDVAVGVVCEMSDLDEFDDEEFNDFDDEDFDGRDRVRFYRRVHGNTAFKSASMWSMSWRANSSNSEKEKFKPRAGKRTPFWPIPSKH